MSNLTQLEVVFVNRGEHVEIVEPTDTLGRRKGRIDFIGADIIIEPTADSRTLLELRQNSAGRYSVDSKTTVRSGARVTSRLNTDAQAILLAHEDTKIGVLVTRLGR